MKGDAAGNCLECLQPVRKMAGVFPEEVADERFGRMPITGFLEKEMFELAGDSADIKDPVGRF